MDDSNFFSTTRKDDQINLPANESIDTDELLQLLESLFNALLINPIDSRLLNELLKLYNQHLFQLPKEVFDCIIVNLSIPQNFEIILEIMKCVAKSDRKMHINSFDDNSILILYDYYQNPKIISTLGYIFAVSSKNMCTFINDERFDAFLEYFSSILFSNQIDSLECFEFLEHISLVRDEALSFYQFVLQLIYRPLQSNQIQIMKTVYTFFYYNPKLVIYADPSLCFPNLISFLQQNNDDEFLSFFLLFLDIFTDESDKIDQLLDTSIMEFIYSIFENVKQENRKRILNILLNLQGNIDDNRYFDFLVSIFMRSADFSIDCQSLIIRLFSYELHDMDVKMLEMMEKTSYINIISQAIPSAGKVTKTAIKKCLAHGIIISHSISYDFESLLRENDDFIQAIEDEEIFESLYNYLFNQDRKPD